MPEFVKQATDDHLAVSDISPDLFADPKRKKFANVSPAATWLNYAMFREQEGQYSSAERQQVADTFVKHAAFWDIGPHLLRIDATLSAASKKQAATKAKTASDDDYALVFKSGSNILRRGYLGSMDGIRKSASWLQESRCDLTLSQRFTAASNILKRASDEGVTFDEDMTDFLQKSAGCGISTAANVYDILSSRATLAEGRTKDMLYKVAGECEDGAYDLQDPQTLFGLAKQIEKIDQQYGWNTKYASGLQLPEEVFDITHRKVAELKHHFVETATGCVYSKEQIHGLPAVELGRHVGESLCKRASINGEIDGDLLATFIKSSGVKVAQAFDRFMTERATPPVRVTSVRRVHDVPTGEAWNALADLYQPSSELAHAG